jgi:serine/threonine-protein kinase/serine/threonine-protein kinase PpkA
MGGISAVFGNEASTESACLGTGGGDFLLKQELQRCLQAFPLDVPGWKMREVLHNSDNAVIFLAENAQGFFAVIKRFKFAVQDVDRARVERFLLGCHALRLLGQQQGLVRLLDAGINHQAIYLVMEYVRGDTLKNHLAASPLPPLSQRLRWFDELVAVLGMVHSAGLLHRDLKTSNILVREAGSLALLDFGIETALLVEAGFLRVDEIYCTPYYVSPERILGDMADERSDLYALGVILYELLVGHKPYDSVVLSELLKKHMLAPIPRLPPRYSAYQLLVDGLLAKSPEDRLQSTDEVVCLLHGL